MYMGGAMTCLLLSSICHLLGCCQVCAFPVCNSVVLASRRMDATGFMGGSRQGGGAGL